MTEPLTPFTEGGMTETLMDRIGGEPKTETLRTQRDLLLHELAEALWFEKKLTEVLPQLSQEANDRELKKGFDAHAKQTQQHVKNVEKAFKALKAEVKEEDCPGIEGIKKEHDEFMSDGHSPKIVDAFLTGAAARTEHYEIAAYDGLVSIARGLGEKQAADLLERNLKQDKETLQRVQKVSKRLAREGGKEETGGRTTRPRTTRSRTTTRARTTRSRTTTGRTTRSRTTSGRSTSGRSTSGRRTTTRRTTRRR
jgi:ferritin-like metal-binding protein YciE